MGHDRSVSSGAGTLMRRLMLCIVVAGLAVGIDAAPVSGQVPPNTPPPAAWSADMRAVADGNNRFAFDLYARLRAEPGNVFFSPYCVYAALTMTADGASGATRDEMTKVLHLPADRVKALAAGDLGRFYARPGRPYELAVANALWGQKGFPWRPEFLARQQRRFGAGLEQADFAAPE